MAGLWKRIGAAVLTVAVCICAAAEGELTGERVLEIERQLYALGYHGESCDSQLDEGTRRALRSLQKANGLEATGQPDSATLQLLDSGEAISCREYLLSLADEYESLPILQTGSVGDAVMGLQRALTDLGYFSGSCDGVFGEATQQALRAFQMANGLTQTGMADQATQLRLHEGAPLSWAMFLEDATCTLGDSGTSVRRLQRRLKEMGYFQGDCTGSYGELTQQAVLQLQKGSALEETGAADYATCEAIYSGKAVAVRSADTLNAGDADTPVAELQERLAELGYFECNLTGIYGATTETAVRLFQMANELPSTGEADAQTLERLNTESAKALGEVREYFAEQVKTQDDAVQAIIGNVALRARGSSFEADDEDLYEGFAFVQYACVASGIPLVSAEDVIELIDSPVRSFDEPEPGDVLAMHLQESEGTQLLLGISTGDGRVAYVPQGSSWVLESHLRDMQCVEIERWDMEKAEE